jgi:hypothetical protein
MLLRRISFCQKYGSAATRHTTRRRLSEAKAKTAVEWLVVGGANARDCFGDDHFARSLRPARPATALDMEVSPYKEVALNKIALTINLTVGSGACRGFIRALRESAVRILNCLSVSR